MSRLSLVLLTSLLFPSLALAHPDVDAGIASYEVGNFAEALEAFDEALASESLTRDDFVMMLEHRALVHHAMDNRADMEADLVRLASLDPDHSLTPAAPPPVRSAFDRVRRRQDEPLHIDVSQDAGPGSVTLRARVAGDTGGMAEELRFSARAAGSDEFRSGDGSSLTLPVGIGAEVEYHATVIGPGGVVLAAEGSERAPTSLTVGEPEPEPEPDQPLRPGDDDDGGVGAGVWIGITLGILAAAAGATVAILLLTQDDEGQLELGPPLVDWP